ncbi:unnamed protein product, partial [Adineta steineri]
TYNASKSIREIIEEVTDTIDNPSENHCVHTDAAAVLSRNKEEYKQKALEAYEKVWLPR